VSSISSLVSTYNLDGVDVDYENFPTGSATFTTCIGQLISNLKSAATISVASIAPFGSTSSIYADLFSNYGSSIDYVNYQFYADGLNTQSDYVNATQFPQALIPLSCLRAWRLMVEDCKATTLLLRPSSCRSRE
jgi:chitinase